jgi:nanoRNase/pAp phosphatase (c-di-AMP/oligoRNAs hydrolase)
MALPTERQFIETVKRSGHALVTFRRDWTVDAVSSALAAARAIRKLGKPVDVVSDGFEPTRQIRFLPGVSEIRPDFSNLEKLVITLDLSKTKLDELSYDMDGDKLRIFVTPKGGRFAQDDLSAASSEFRYDLIITVDTPDYRSLGRLFDSNAELFYKRPTLNVDHDPGNEMFGNINAVDITASSTAEILHGLFKKADEHFLDEETATLLLTGMISKTRSFKSPAVTPRTLDVASELIAAGAKREEIVQNLYRTRTVPVLKLWGRALARLKHDPVTKTAWTLLVRQDFIHAGAGEESLPDIIDELIVNAPEAEVTAILYEQEDTKERGKVGGICALVSTERHADAMKLVSPLKPEGHRRLARVCFPGGTLPEAEKAVIISIGKALGKEKKMAAAVS